MVNLDELVNAEEHKKSSVLSFFKRNGKSILVLALVCVMIAGTLRLAEGSATDTHEASCSTYFAHEVIKDYIRDPGEYETTKEALKNSVYLTDNGFELLNNTYIHNYLNFLHSDDMSVPVYDKIKYIKEDLEGALLDHFKETLKINCNLPEDAEIKTYYKKNVLRKDDCIVTYESESTNTQGEITLSDEYKYVLKTIADLQGETDKVIYCCILDDAIAANIEMDSVKLKQKEIRIY